ncbi:hypothetical protein Nepgr_013664 [Nepenthes gracilis]|uniref:Uncharacterized protein n=1 Tax=Nepenthes gracilis TaxID=150966 RepID=A0AAD3SI95_NEPGR|nr:hypothetical protein Nepgr_013664 [Nepenthes gracilis]
MIVKGYRKLVNCRCSVTTASPLNPEQARVPPVIQLPIPTIYQFKIGLFQIFVREISINCEPVNCVKVGCSRATKAIDEDAQKGAKLVVLPASSWILSSLCMCFRLCRCQQPTQLLGAMPTQLQDMSQMLKSL